MSKFKLALWKKILIGMGSGLIVGSVIGEYGNYLQPFGSIFINIIQMIVIPLVFCSLVAAMTADYRRVRTRVSCYSTRSHWFQGVLFVRQTRFD